MYSSSSNEGSSELCPLVSLESVTEIIDFFTLVEGDALGREINSSALWLGSETCFMNSLIRAWDHPNFPFTLNLLELQYLRTKFCSPPGLIEIIHNWLESYREEPRHFCTSFLAKKERRRALALMFPGKGWEQSPCSTTGLRCAGTT